MSEDSKSEPTVEAVDAKRQELEANVNRLRNALQHWQKWEIDYGEFQEKLEDVTDEPSYSDLIRIRDSIDTALITDSEVKELLGTEKGIKRGRDQINALIARRVDYMQQNAQSLQKQLDTAEIELGKLSGVQDIDFHDEQGLPITEILEELDDDGNVVSGRTSTAQQAAADAAGLLSKAGVKDWIDPLPTDESPKAKAEALRYIADPRQADPTSATIPTSISSADSAKTSKRKKSVAFAKDLDIAPSAPQHDHPAPPIRQGSPPPTALPPTPITSRPSVPWEVAEARRGRFHSGTRVIEVNENDDEIGSLPVVPPEDFEETEEEARLRREMTQYALNEVGAIVAEMDIEEGSDYEDGSIDDDDDVAPADYNSAGSEDEDENEFGMTAFDRISDEDRKQMLELEKKLQARVIQNLGPAPSLDDMDVDADDVRRLVIKKEAAEEPGDKHRRSSKVHFAEDAEVVPSPATREEASGRPAFADQIVERKTQPAPAEDSSDTKNRKPSRFKSAIAADVRSAAQLRSDAQRPVLGQGVPSIPIHMRDQGPSMQARPDAPTGPTGQVLSSTVLERPARPEAIVAPDETGMDPALVQQQLAVENRRLFNKMVQQQGGFKPSPEDEDNPLMEEKDGKVRKVSRFKAARINAGGI